jgi:hypothetical protein
MTSPANPEIKIPLTTTGKITEAIGLLLLFSFWYFTLSLFSQLPNIIPTHYRTNNVVDGYGSKWNIIMLPIVASILYLGLTIVARFPHKMNHLVTITEANARKQYSIITEMFRILKIAIVIVFFIIAFETVQIALGLPDVFGKWFLLIAFTLVFAPIFYFLIISSKNA